MRTRGFDGADAIHKDAAIIIGFWVENPLGHKAREKRVRAFNGQVGSVAFAPRAALPARVHNEMGKAGRRPCQPVGGETAPAAIADVFNDAGEGTVAVAGQHEPAFDWLSAIAGKGDIVAFDGAQTVIYLDKARRQRMLARV